MKYSIFLNLKLPPIINNFRKTDSICIFIGSFRMGKQSIALPQKAKALVEKSNLKCNFLKLEALHSDYIITY